MGRCIGVVVLAGRFRFRWIVGVVVEVNWPDGVCGASQAWDLAVGAVMEQVFGRYGFGGLWCQRLMRLR